MIIKNAIKNLGRNKGRTLLLIGVTSIIMLASACSMVVHLSAKQLAQKQMQKIGAQVIITRNDEKLENQVDFSNFREISIKQMKSFTTSSLIKDSAIYVSTAGKTTLKTIEGSGISNGSGMQPDGSQTNSSDTGMFNYESPNILLIGSTNPKINEDFAKGLRKIKEGKMYEKVGEIIIGEELAKKNQLKVGDTFPIDLTDLGISKQASSTAFTISGIFEDHKAAGENDVGSLNKNNEIFMNYETFESFNANGGVSLEGAFYLKNPDDVKALEKEFHEKGMPEYYELSLNRNAYDKSVAPIKEVANITQVFSIALLVVGALIMVALSLLSIRERKYEIGVLRAMGMTKTKINLMLCIEMCSISLLCALIALAIAKVGAQPIADSILASTKVTESVQFGAFFVGSGVVAPIAKIPAILSIEAIVFIFCIAIALAIFGSACSVFYVTRKEPMKILAERN